MYSCCMYLPPDFALRLILGMYFAERRGAGRQWIRELNYKNELKAWIGARRKAIATLDTYRVVHELSPDEVVYCVKGSELVKD